MHQRCFLKDGWSGGQQIGSPDDHDLRDLPEGAQHGLEPAGKKGAPGRLIGRTKGGVSTKLHSGDGEEWPPDQVRHDGRPDQRSHRVAALLDDLPAVKWLLPDCGYDADWFREGLEEKGIRP